MEALSTQVATEEVLLVPKRTTKIAHLLKN